MPDSPNSPRNNPSRRRRVLLFIIAPVVLLFAVWWWQRPAQYHLVGKYVNQVGSRLLVPCAKGFLTQETATTFVFRDWEGKVCWRVTSATAKTQGWPRVIDLPTNNTPYFTISPNGRTFATATSDGPQRVRVQIWRDGNPAGEHQLGVAFPELAAPSRNGKPRMVNWHRNLLRAFDSGQVMVQEKTTGPEWFAASTMNVVLLDGAKVVARGAGLPLGTIAPDGKGCYGRGKSSVEYTALTVKDGRIVPGAPVTIPTRMHTDEYFEWSGAALGAFANGVALAENGAVYHDGKSVSGASAWHQLSISPDGEYALQQQQDSPQLRVFAPGSGDAWEFAGPDKKLIGDATMDGRHAFVGYTPHLPAALGQLDGLLPSAGNWLRSKLSGEYLLLYERPGRLRAQLSISADDVDTINSLWPSPDGHACVVMLESSPNECRLYRW